MTALESPSRISVDDYLAFEQTSKIRHELVDGYLYAMTGASDRYEELAANLLAILHGHLKGSGCRVYGSNLKIRIGDDLFYPDLFVTDAVQPNGETLFPKPIQHWLSRSCLPVSRSMIEATSDLSIKVSRPCRNMCWLLRIPLPSRFIVAQPTDGNVRLTRG